MIISKEAVDLLKARIAQLEAENQRLLNVICQSRGIAAPFPEAFPPPPPPPPARKSIEQHLRELELKERIDTDA